MAYTRNIHRLDNTKDDSMMHTERDMHSNLIYCILVWSPTTDSDCTYQFQCFTLIMM